MNEKQKLFRRKKLCKIIVLTVGLAISLFYEESKTEAAIIDKEKSKMAQSMDVSLGDNGEINEIKIDKKTCARDIGLSIVYADNRFFSTQYDTPFVWRPFGNQSDPVATRAMKRTNDEGNMLFKGRITSSEPKHEGRDFLADIKSFLFEEKVVVNQKQVRLSYEVKADISLEGISVNFIGALPQEDIENATYVVHASKFTRKGSFSEADSQLDSLVYDDVDFHWIGWLLKNGKGIKIKPESGIWRVMLGKGDFKLFPAKNFFKARERISFSVTIEPLTAKEVNELTAKKNKPPIFKEKLAINSISENKKKTGMYEKFELTLDISATYHDAFDPDQIAIESHFTSPSGKAIDLCGFLYQDYERNSSDVNYLIPKGNSCWKIRFAPTEIGTYKYYVTVKDKSGEVASKEQTFECIPSNNPGFARVSKKDPSYFEFDSGEFYYPIGHDTSWTLSVFYQLDHNYYFAKMGKEGINATRGGCWATQAIHTKITDRLSRLQRLGYQNLPDNWVLDQMVDSAEENGIHIMFTLLNFWFFRSEERKGKPHAPAMWWENPYNVARGGVCAKPEDFFTSPEAKTLLKRELRYIVARWGYSTAIWTWEMWNENDGSWLMQECGEENVYNWYKDIVPYLRSADPYNHLISTSFCDPGDPIPRKIYGIPEMDYTQYHTYPNANAPFPTVKGMLSTYGFFKMFNKPGIIGEFGIASPAFAERFDFFGRSYHYGIWSSVMMPLAGTAMAYSMECIEQNDFYSLYKPVANFMKGEDRRGKKFQPATITIDNPSLGICGIQNEKEAQFWIYSRDPKIAGEYPEQGVPPFPLFKDVTVTLYMMQKGEYKIEFWDTWEGVITGTKRQKIDVAKLDIKIPELNQDTAVKVKIVKKK